MILERISPVTRKTNKMELDISEEELKAFYRGTRNIRDMFPHLTNDECEFIQTGIMPEDWNIAFANDDE